MHLLSSFLPLVRLNCFNFFTTNQNEWRSEVIVIIFI
jgi:hypothetical protein